MKKKGRNLKGQAMIEYVVVVGIVIAISGIFSSFIITFFNHYNRVFDLLTLPYP
jgi:uncharacterized membrane protein